MASKETRRKFVIISLSRSVADLIEHSGISCPAAKARGLAAAIRHRSRKCFDLWPSRLSRAEVDRINKRVKELNQGCFSPDGETGITLLSGLVITLLNGLRENEPHGRAHVIDDLIAACRQANQYYGQRSNQHLCYHPPQFGIEAKYFLTN